MNALRAPIGVFDSGLGGLTVVSALGRRLPHEAIIYVGDTARLPYGPKSPETVRRYADEITAWLVAQRVKAVVVACNTATAHALAALQARYPLPVVGVVEPGARAAVAASPSRRIGVIGTAGTVASGAYERAIRAIAPTAHVWQRACPLFAPLVEEGWLDHPVTHLVAEEYLHDVRGAGIESLVLGCTHYPLLRRVIAGHLAPGVRLIDSADETAEETARVLAAHGLAAPPGPTPAHRFVASDAPGQFQRLAERFLGAPVEHVEAVTFG